MAMTTIEQALQLRKQKQNAIQDHMLGKITSSMIYDLSKCISDTKPKVSFTFTMDRYNGDAEYIDDTLLKCTRSIQ